MSTSIQAGEKIVKLQESDEGTWRTVNVNSKEQESVFPTNEVISSKYTPLSFLPIGLFEQFSRAANC